MRTSFSLPVLILILITTTHPHVSHALQKQLVRCCTIPEAPIVIDQLLPGDSDDFAVNGFSGIGIRYLSLLLNRTGLQCSSLVHYAPNSQYGADLSHLDEHEALISDGDQFDNFIIKMHQCTVFENGKGFINTSDETCVCDLGVGAWAINERRLGLVDFLPPFLFDHFAVATSKGNTVPNTSVFFMRTFTFKVWVCVFALIAVFTMLKYMDRHFAPWKKTEVDTDTDARGLARASLWIMKGRFPFRLRKAFQSTIGHMMGVPNDEIPGEFGTFRQGLLNFLIFIAGLFLILIYGSSMTASIVQEAFGSDFRDINDLKLCRIPTKEVCLLGGDGVELLWNMSIGNLECHRAEGWIMPRVFPSENFIDAMEATKNQTCKYLIGLGSSLRYVIERLYCGKVVLTGEPFFAEGVSFVVPSKSNLTIGLSKATLDLKNEDAVKTILDLFDNSNNCIPSRPRSLTFRKLQWFFFLAFGASVLLFLEMVFDKRRAGRVSWMLQRMKKNEEEQESEREQQGS